MRAYSNWSQNSVRAKGNTVRGDIRESAILSAEVEATVSTEKYILIFDICSSSQIIEDLQNNERMDVWDDFLLDITKVMEEYIAESGIEALIYKFLGDGYILIVSKKHSDEILPLCYNIYNTLINRIKKLIEEFSNIEPNRIGITIGVDYGRLHQIGIRGKEEFVGKSINTAARLQASLKEKEHENKLLISKVVKKSICGPYKSDLYKSTTRQMRNLYGENKFYCYEIDLTMDLNDFLKSSDTGRIDDGKGVIKGSAVDS